MNITAREFTSGSAQIAHYAEVWLRLFGAPSARHIKTVPIATVEEKAGPPPEPIVNAPLPLWSVVDIYFDWHVRVWREAIERQISDLAHENVALRAALGVHRADLEMAMTPRRLTKHIIAEVLEKFPGVTWADLKSQRRTRDVVYPRQLCMYEVHRQRKDMSYPKIGRLFGGRDHTTVLHAVRKIAAKRGEA
ncbi:chromosomal replication initiator DnaA-like domain-containing protein [Rhizobium phage RHph_N28_2]|nr:chromosomal replication initiator DnaA-like domain-containing protein [Rhizobium phage RHph_N28_2]